MKLIHTVNLTEAAALCSTSVVIVRRWVDAERLALATRLPAFGDERRVSLRELYDFAKSIGKQLPEFESWVKGDSARC